MEPPAANQVDPNQIAQWMAIRKAHKDWIGAQMEIYSAESMSVEGETQIQKLLAARDVFYQKMTTIINLDKLIIDNSPAESIAMEVTESSDFEQKMKVIIIKIDAMLNKSSSATPKPETPTPVKSKHKPSLPDINIPLFYGDPLLFNQFWDLFKVIIHDNTELTNLEKSAYLTSLLRKDALDAVAGVRRSEETYPQIVNILQSRFNKPDKIKNTILYNLSHIPVLKNDRCAKEMRKHFEYIRSNVVSLSSLPNCDPETYDGFVVPYIIQSLPRNLQLRVLERTSKDNTVDAALCALDHHINLQENLANVTGSHSQVSKSVSFHTSNNNTNSGRKTKCLYCFETSHTAIVCEKYPTVQARKQFIVEGKRCFNCLQAGHQVRTCRSSIRCNKCSRKHHSTLHGDNTSSSSSSS